MTLQPWPSPARDRPLAVAIPGSVLAVEQDLRDKTYKVGLLSRLFAVFRVDEVYIYADEETSDRDVEILRDLLEYQVVPPHLKRRLVPVKDTLKFAGVMPPLRLPNHSPPERPVAGYVVDGVIDRVRGSQCDVFLGNMGVGVLRPCNGSAGQPVTVRISRVEGGRILLEPASWGRVYVGYRVSVERNLPALVERLRASGYLIVGTSKYGSLEYSALKLLRERPALVVFGGPEEGLLSELSRRAFDLMINAVPLQGTETVRTEEAVAATLAIINALSW